MKVDNYCVQADSNSKVYLRDNKPKMKKKSSRKSPSKPTTEVDDPGVFSKPSEETILDEPLQMFEKLSLDEK